MPIIKNSPLQLSRIALLTELIERASERIQGLQGLNALDYIRTLSEIQRITARINELVLCMESARRLPPS